MAISNHDTFARDAADLLVSPGEIGTTWTRHPAWSATTSHQWKLTDLGGAYPTVAGYAGVVYLASGIPAGEDYDVGFTFEKKSVVYDSSYGVMLDAAPTTLHGLFAYWDEAGGYWSLQHWDGSSVANSSNYADAIPNLGTRSCRVTRRLSGGTVTAKLFVGGVERCSVTYTPAADATRRVGLCAKGGYAATATTGSHITQFAAGDADFVMPDDTIVEVPEYNVTGPANGPPGFASLEFVFTLVDGVNPGSLVITPAMTGLAGTWSPTTITLTDGGRTGTATFTPTVMGEGVVSFSNNGVKPDPDDRPFESAWAPPTRLAEWESRIHKFHTTGSSPYLTGEGYYLDGEEHYDIIGCIYAAQDYCRLHNIQPDDWPDQLVAARIRYRDRGVLPNVGYGLAGHHINTTGLVRDYYETGDPLDLEAIKILWGTAGGAGATNPVALREVDIHLGNVRPIAFYVMSSVDREAVGLPRHPLFIPSLQLLLLDHIEQWAAPPGTYFGTWSKPFMCGLVLRALIMVWDRFRDTADPDLVSLVAIIPERVKALLAYLWEYPRWFPDGVLADGWDHGGVGYQVPGATELYASWVTSTVATRTSDKVFTGGPELSDVDDFYKYSAILDAGLIIGYVGATREFTLTSWYNTGPIVQGQEITITQVGWEIVENGCSPILNPMIAPGYAWAYWHTRHVEGNAAGSMVHRARHDAMFNGQTMAWDNLFAQKQWNQVFLWGTDGLRWRDRGDFEFPAATTFNLQVPANGNTGEVGVDSAPFRVSLPEGTYAANPVHVIPSGGAGIFIPSEAILTTDRPRAVFHYVPAPQDDGTTVSISATATGLTAPPAVPYIVGVPSGEPGTYVVLAPSPASGVVAVPSAAFTVTPSANFTGTLTPYDAGASGTITPLNLTWSGTQEAKTFTYTPASVGTKTISFVNTGGFTNPSSVTYIATAVTPPDEEEPPGVPVVRVFSRDIQKWLAIILEVEQRKRNLVNPELPRGLMTGAWRELTKKRIS